MAHVRTCRSGKRHASSPRPGLRQRLGTSLERAGRVRRMDDTEQTVTGLLEALREVELVLREGRAALLGDDAWSSVTTELEVTEWDGGTRLGFSGYLDGEL